MDNGFIKIYRSLLDWEWYKDVNTRLVFIHLLLNANWEESKYMGYDIPKGGLVVGLNSLSESVGISVQSIRTSLNHLKSTNEITIKSTNKFSIVTIVNWEKYQGFNDELTNKSTSSLTNNQQTTNKQLTTEEEYKNIRNEEYNINYCQKAQEIVDLYHERCPSLPKVLIISQKRISLVKARLKDYSIEQIKEVFDKAESSDFLKNGSGTWKGANFEWILNPNNFIKIMEGNYQNKTNNMTDNKRVSQEKGYQNGSNADFLKFLENEVSNR